MLNNCIDDLLAMSCDPCMEPCEESRTAGKCASSQLVVGRYSLVLDCVCSQAAVQHVQVIDCTFTAATEEVATHHQEVRSELVLEVRKSTCSSTSH